MDQVGENAIFYDSFGEKIRALNALKSNDDFETDYLIVAKNSRIYEVFDDLTVSDKDLKN